jgi:hypothetical protein
MAIARTNDINNDAVWVDDAADVRGDLAVSVSGALESDSDPVIGVKTFSLAGANVAFTNDGVWVEDGAFDGAVMGFTEGRLVGCGTGIWVGAFASAFVGGLIGAIVGNGVGTFVGAFAGA